MCSFSPSKSPAALHASLGSKRPRSGVNVSVLGHWGVMSDFQIGISPAVEALPLGSEGYHGVSILGWDSGMADSSRVEMMGLKSSTIHHNHPQLCRCLSPTFNIFQLPWPCGGNRGERQHPPEASTMLTSCLEHPLD